MTLSAAANPSIADVPLCLDLDGTLCRTDTMFESLLHLVRKKPSALLSAPFWLLRGRPWFKSRLAEYVMPDVDALPYNQKLMEHLKEQRAAGRKIVLITGANEAVARAVAAHLGVFDEVIASTADTQMTGAAKLAVLKKRFGAQGFDYAGDSAPDLIIWPEARESIFAGRSRRIGRKFEALPGKSRRISDDNKPRWSALLRVHQWAKNVIVFVPLLASHRVTERAEIIRSVLVFIAMCLCASGTYIVNDLLDLSADRRHAHKRHRPFAAGDLPLEFGLVLAPLLVCAGLVIGVGLSLSCFAVLGIYILTTLAYSLYLKSRMLVDVFTLAGLYTIRIIAGHVAGDIIFSAWLLGFSIFLFLSLALVKRVSELHNLRLSNREKPEGRGYLNADLEMLQQLGLISGGLAVLILALYVNSPAETLLYKHPLPLLALCPILFYWIARLWLITHRGNMQSDPVLFALKDRVSYYLLVAAAIIVVCSARF